MGDDLVLGQVRRVDALEEVVEGYLAPARAGEAMTTSAFRREQDRREVGGGVAVRHRAADRAPGADLGVGEDREGVGEGRDAGAAARGPVDEGGRPVAVDVTLAAQLPVGGERADGVSRGPYQGPA